MPGLARTMPPIRGNLVAQRIPGQGFYARGLPDEIPLRYRLRTYWYELALRARLFVKGAWRGLHASGIIAVSRLYATVLRADGRIEHLGLISTRVVTNAGVTFLRDDWNGGANDFSLMNFHGVGTGVAAENVTDTALGTESTTVLNPDSVRATGTKSVPTSNTCLTVGTVTFDGSAAITEHGIFSTSGTGTGTLWDRSVFSAINVAALDSIQLSYTLTLPSGG